jgi:hypothetical protein
MKIQEIYVNQANGTEYTCIRFEVINDKPITAEQWYEINNKIEDIMREVLKKG